MQNPWLIYFDLCSFIFIIVIILKAYANSYWYLGV